MVLIFFFRYELIHFCFRMKLQCTAQYIYQTLFISGKDSDITVNILNKDWKLHKVYLGQVIPILIYFALSFT